MWMNTNENFFYQPLDFQTKLTQATKWIQEILEDKKIEEEEIINPNGILLCKLMNKLTYPETTIPKIYQSPNKKQQLDNLSNFRRQLEINFEIETLTVSNTIKLIEKDQKARLDLVTSLYHLQIKTIILSIEKKESEKKKEEDSEPQMFKLPTGLSSSDEDIIELIEKNQKNLTEKNNNKKQLDAIVLLSKKLQEFESKPNAFESPSHVHRKKASLPKIGMEFSPNPFSVDLTENDKNESTDELFALDEIYLSMTPQRWNLHSELNSMKNITDLFELKNQIIINSVVNFARTGKADFVIHLILPQEEKIPQKGYILSLRSKGISLEHNLLGVIVTTDWSPNLKIGLHEPKSKMIHIALDENPDHHFLLMMEDFLQRDTLIETVKIFNETRSQKFPLPKIPLNARESHPNLPKHVSKNLKTLSNMQSVDNKDVYLKNFLKEGKVTFLTGVFFTGKFVPGYIKIRENGFKIGICVDNHYRTIQFQKFQRNLDHFLLRGDQRMMKISPNFQKIDYVLLFCDTLLEMQILENSIHFFWENWKNSSKKK
ncbi:muscle-specific protein [Anaeramoeba ignava]|uniref:Muscle-specific protein n=1 Tax=Anaeramoeba ignava TaxID=1746090 RepID=A0A9Q0LJ90_ANAIG|nr:muscle-specific protein [Anaeramoeba ignava]